MREWKVRGGLLELEEHAQRHGDELEAFSAAEDAGHREDVAGFEGDAGKAEQLSPPRRGGGQQEGWRPPHPVTPLELGEPDRGLARR